MRFYGCFLRMYLWIAVIFYADIVDMGGSPGEIWAGNLNGMKRGMS